MTTATRYALILALALAAAVSCPAAGKSVGC